MVINGDITILELKTAGAKAKKIASLKKFFVKLTNNDNWERCEVLYPHLIMQPQKSYKASYK